jgi:pimeloyl-ACP methyl ester carboxylesterase
MRVKTPTLILWGAQDFAFTTEIAYASTKYGDQMVARVIPGLGHWLTHEAPATINEEIQSFLEMD